MKYLLLLITLTMMSSTLRAPETPYHKLMTEFSIIRFSITRPEPVHKPDLILNAFIVQESSNNQFAYRKSEDACGILQIRQVMIDEANRISGCEKYRLIDAWDVKKSVEIWYLVMQDRNPEYSIKKAVTIWQGKFVKSYYKSILNKIKNS